MVEYWNVSVNISLLLWLWHMVSLLAGFEPGLLHFGHLALTPTPTLTIQPSPSLGYLALTLKPIPTSNQILLKKTNVLFYLFMLLSSARPY